MKAKAYITRLDHKGKWYVEVEMVVDSTPLLLQLNLDEEDYTALSQASSGAPEAFMRTVAFQLTDLQH